MELFTPMLHAKMMPLLGEVYKGKIDSDHARLREYGGQKMEAQVVEGGVRFAAVDQVSQQYRHIMSATDTRCSAI
jgi:calcium permeable stress-gated cation channel